MDREPVTTLNARPRIAAFPAPLSHIVGDAEVAQARGVIASWRGYRPTPLVDLPGLAAALGVASVTIKHEGERFAIGSFKALGPPFALWRELERRGALGIAARFTAVAATSGNHGRALAWGARRLGANSRIFMPAHTSLGREAAIRSFGAEVSRIAGNFDAALDAAIADSARHADRILIADIPGDTGSAVARDTLAGYAVLADEIATQAARDLPSHVFVAAGNGSLAAASCARLWQVFGARRPRLISVEPVGSDCVRRSLDAGSPIALAHAGDSVMDGLVVGTPSQVAWPILQIGLDAALAIHDEVAIATLRNLAHGAWGPPSVEIGETGVAAIAGLVAACSGSKARAALAISARSNLLAIACEGVTDRAVFEALTRVISDPDSG